MLTSLNGTFWYVALSIIGVQSIAISCYGLYGVVYERAVTVKRFVLFRFMILIIETVFMVLTIISTSASLKSACIVAAKSNINVPKDTNYDGYCSSVAAWALTTLVVIFCIAIAIITYCIIIVWSYYKQLCRAPNVAGSRIQLLTKPVTVLPDTTYIAPLKKPVDIESQVESK
ncbi:hypothetical protein MP638_006051 [Amoeboaphelidium occidentale]|nr:hypothetical protein MP638_006051 [Amoeboaphelidium occidentale]